MEGTTYMSLNTAQMSRAVTVSRRVSQNNLSTSILKRDLQESL